MKYALVVLALVLAGCSDRGDSEYTPTVMTYQQLVDYPVSCELADKQLWELERLQEQKGFDSDPDKLSEEDRIFNSRLKATIWWYAYRCEK
jgi:hypothetical protein